MAVVVSTAVPDLPTQEQILALTASIEAATGVPPLSDQARLRLDEPTLRHVVVRDDGRLVGYVQQNGDVAEIVAAADLLGVSLDAGVAAGSTVWTHGSRSALVDVLLARRAESVRELYQLRMPLDAAHPLPPTPSLPHGTVIRRFRPGVDDDAWLQVNAAAFAEHAEQGRLTTVDLQARLAEPWFDAAGFLLAERGGRLVGFHWTKVHPDGAGEVYALGVAPTEQGSGLGRALLLSGLHRLQQVGCRYLVLYVDGDNTGARRLYERIGFVQHDVDRQWRLIGRAPAAG